MKAVDWSKPYFYVCLCDMIIYLFIIFIHACVERHHYHVRFYCMVDSNVHQDHFLPPFVI